MTKNFKGLVLTGLFWSGMTLMFDGFTVVPAVRQVLAQRFSTTQGTILFSEVTHHEDIEGDTHGVRITYSYTVAGREYVSERYRYNTVSTSDFGWANRAVAANPVGAKVTVHYDPRAPEEALLRPGLAGSDLIMVMFMTPFNAVMLGFGWFGWHQLVRKWRKPVAGGVKLRTKLRRTRACLAQYSPLVVAIATTALLATLSLLIVMIGFGGFHPPLRVMQIAWGIVIALGFTAGLWHWIKILTGKYDLIIDELNGSSQLPPTCGRKTAKTFSLQEIHGAFVDTIEKRDSESTTCTYVPTLRLSADDGPTEKLAEWYDEDRARGFVAWLNEKLGRRTSQYRTQKDDGNPPQS